MYLNGRWVPMDVVYTILAGWIAVVAIIAAAYFWFKRPGTPPAGPDRHALPGGGRKKKRSGRNKRYR